MNLKPIPDLVMQYQLTQWLGLPEYGVYALRVFGERNEMELDNTAAEQIDIFNGHATIAISSTASVLPDVPDVGQRGTLPGYTMSSGETINITGDCDTYKLWYDNIDVTPIDDNTWTGTFTANEPGIYVLEGRKGLNSGFILIGVTDAT